MRKLRTENEIIQNWKVDLGKPMVSVSCFTYNHEPYIEDCLAGFLIQETDFPFEILIHDDASTDKTADIIRKYEAQYPKLIKPIYQSNNQLSQGKSPLTPVIEKSRGKYIAMCEGDDYWIEKLKLQNQFICSEEKDLALCVHSSKHANLQSQITVKHSLPASGFVSAEDIIRRKGDLFATASYFFRKDVISEMPNWVSQAPVGDYFWTIFAASQGRVYYLREAMCVYRVLSLNSWSSRPKSIDWHDKFYYALECALDQFNDMTKGKYHKSILAKKRLILADNIREHTKFDKKKAIKKLLKNFFKIGIKDNAVILNRIAFK